MKRIYLFLTIAIVAIALIVISLMHFDPAVESWSSLFAGAAVGLLIIKLPDIVLHFKKAKVKRVK